MVSLNSAEVNFIAYGWDEDNKAAMSLRCFVARNHSWENEKMRIWEFENLRIFRTSKNRHHSSAASGRHFRSKKQGSLYKALTRKK